MPTLSKAAADKEKPPMAGIKMDRGLFKKAKARAKQKHQTLSEYVRQLIVCDLRA